MEEGFLAAAIRYVKEHPGRVCGTAVGLLIGLSLIYLGFWRTLILSLATFIGNAIGKWTDDEGKGLKEFLEETFPGKPDFR
ncbi:MAG: DUF2273 domain-containing protein [Bacillota bacterium]|jgi:uncharacterized membrane protein